MQGTIKMFDPATREGIVVRDTDREELVLAADALEGSIFRIIEFVPDKAAPHPPDAKALRKTMGVSLGGPEARHPGMHRTESIDYALILDGEIDMLVDDGEVHLKKGDVVIQGACNHAWANRGDKPCTIAFILIGAKTDWSGQGY